MKKIILLIVLVFTFNGTFAQMSEKELLKKTEEAAAAKAKDDKPDGWKKSGTFSLLGGQSSFSNWAAGGQNTIAGNVGLNYNFNYKKGNYSWDNQLLAGYGLTKLSGQDMKKSDDRLQFNSLLGKKANGLWYYSLFFNFKTQMDSGFDQGTGVKTSHFFSPAYFQFGPGMMWKKSDNLKFNFAPATSRLIIVDNQFTQFGSSFGVLQGKTSRYEFGGAINAYYKFNLMENVSVENILNLYSNYLDNPQNVDVDYTLNITMKINKVLSTNFAFQTIYDDNAFSGLQTRQVFGLGVNYTFQ